MPPLQFHPWLHPVFEALAYSGGFAVYLSLKKRRGDPLPSEQRLTVITAAAVGAALGSKLLALFEQPSLTLAHLKDPLLWMGGKTVVGGLVGGWLAVELAKKIAGIRTATGDLFAIPICAGIIIGRIGCFMAGIADHTYGNPTSLPWGVDFGDGIPRHPTQIYEIVFLMALVGFIHWRSLRPYRVGDLFKYFMLGYLGLRLAIDFIKPIPAVWMGLSSIQWVCVGALLVLVLSRLRDAVLSRKTLTLTRTGDSVIAPRSLHSRIQAGSGSPVILRTRLEANISRVNNEE